MFDMLYPIRRLHGALFEESQRRKQLGAIIERIKSTPDNDILFVLTPTHGNLGDHAIAEAASDLLHDMQISYTEVTTSELKLLSRYHKLKIMNGRPILVNGGGNLGTLWPKVEKLFREIIKSTPKSKIICLPNTIYYEPSSAGKKELQQSRKIYNGHEHLVLCAREEQSFELMQHNYRHVILVPDMALFMNKCTQGTERIGCMLCLRNDIERTRTESETKVIQEQTRKLFNTHVKISDMNIGRTVSVTQRHSVLEEKFTEFRSVELVITDRLHGMIFSAITGTPCIILNSKSPKVKGCFHWIKALDYMCFVDTPQDITKAYETIKGKFDRYHNFDLLPYYNMLTSEIHSCFFGNSEKY